MRTWRRRGSAPAAPSKKLAGPDAGIAERDAGQPDLLREGATAAGAGEPPDPPGGIPESRVLQGTGDADVGVGQAARHRLRRELPAAHRVAARMSRRRAGTAAGQRHRCDLHDERYAGEPIDVGFVGQLAARSGSGRRGDAASRCRCALRADCFRQDGHCGGNDCAPGREHPGAGASHRTAQAMAGAPAGIPGRRQGRRSAPSAAARPSRPARSTSP